MDFSREFFDVLTAKRDAARTAIPTKILLVRERSILKLKACPDKLDSLLNLSSIFAQTVTLREPKRRRTMNPERRKTSLFSIEKTIPFIIYEDVHRRRGVKKLKRRTGIEGVKITSLVEMDFISAIFLSSLLKWRLNSKIKRKR
jgi:hypothetical protein